MPPRTLLLIALFATAPGARAAEPPPGSLVHLTASAAESVANDRMTAILAVERQGRDPARLAQAVNAAMAGALREAGAYPAVQAESGGYGTAPLYEKGVQTGWRMWQELHLESAETGPLSGLIGKLQAQLQVRSLAFSVSAPRRARTDDALIARALAAFRARAGLIARTLGAGSWELVRMDVQTQQETPGPVYALGMAQTARAAPALAAGLTTVRVTVAGEIRLRPPVGSR